MVPPQPQLHQHACAHRGLEVDLESRPVTQPGGRMTSQVLLSHPSSLLLRKDRVAQSHPPPKSVGGKASPGAKGSTSLGLR